MTAYEQNCKEDKRFRKVVYRIADKRDIPKGTMFHRLSVGTPILKIAKRHINREEVQIDGVWYESISEAVRQTKWKETTIRRYRGEDGVFRYDPQAPPAIEVEFLGQGFPDIKSVAAFLELPETTYRRWRSLGLSDQKIYDRALERSEKNSRK